MHPLCLISNQGRCGLQMMRNLEVLGNGHRKLDSADRKDALCTGSYRDGSGPAQTPARARCLPGRAINSNSAITNTLCCPVLDYRNGFYFRVYATVVLLFPTTSCLPNCVGEREVRILPDGPSTGTLVEISPVFATLTKNTRVHPPSHFQNGTRPFSSPPLLSSPPHPLEVL